MLHLLCTWALDDDLEYILAVKEAATWASGRSLRKLLVNGSLKQPNIVWREISSLLAEDLLYINRHEAARTGKFIAPNLFHA